MKNINKENPIVAWWSGGVTSAVSCKLCIDMYGLENIRLIFIDTHNEDDDTYRFKKECENWYKNEIETISNSDYKSIYDVWYEQLSLNMATGAICSNKLKRVVRERFEKANKFSYQVFGFDINEIRRAKGMKNNNPNAKPLFPLISELLSKKECVKIIEKANDLFTNIRLPRPYYEGFLNNNCFKTGCVQGGIGYWQKIKMEYPDKYEAMAKVEHDLTAIKGRPVTILKDQSKNGGLIFLKHNPNYPNIKDITQIKGRKILPLIECNGFCGMDDIEKSSTINEINFDILNYE
jgi:hypothetical protein